MKIAELYEQVTRNIITEIEAGNLPPWLKPWRGGRRTGIIPINGATKRHYNGLNILVLWSEREAKGYPINEWVTYKQCQALGGNVKKGEKSTQVIFVKKLVVKDDDEERKIPMMKCYSIFNVGQCEGLPQNVPEPELPEHERNERAEQFFAAVGAQVRWDEAMAAYIPSKDIITMPARGAFIGPENVYATLAHEHIHFTGAKSRLDRDLKGRFDQDAYGAGSRSDGHNYLVYSCETAKTISATGRKPRSWRGENHSALLLYD